MAPFRMCAARPELARPTQGLCDRACLTQVCLTQDLPDRACLTQVCLTQVSPTRAQARCAARSTPPE